MTSQCKTKTDITFDLDVILTWSFFKKLYFLEVFQLKKQNYVLFLECITALKKKEYNV